MQPDFENIENLSLYEINAPALILVGINTILVLDRIAFIIIFRIDFIGVSINVYNRFYRSRHAEIVGKLNLSQFTYARYLKTPTAVH